METPIYKVELGVMNDYPSHSPKVYWEDYTATKLFSDRSKAIEYAKSQYLTRCGFDGSSCVVSVYVYSQTARDGEYHNGECIYYADKVINEKSSTH